MADEAKQDPGVEAAGSTGASPGGSTINSQVVDSIAALNALSQGSGPSTSAAMLGLMGADSVALAMLNAVARQQADATIASAAFATACARIVGTHLPGAAVPANSAPLVAVAAAQASSAVAMLKNLASQEGDAAKAASAALAEIAADLASPPAVKRGEASKSGAPA